MNLNKNSSKAFLSGAACFFFSIGEILLQWEVTKISIIVAVAGFIMGGVGYYLEEK